MKADVARALADFRRCGRRQGRRGGKAGRRLAPMESVLVELILLARTGPAAGGGELSAAVAEEGGGHG